MNKQHLKISLLLIKDEVRKIKKQYVCGIGMHGDGLTAKDGFEVLIERIENKIKKSEQR